MATTAQAIDTHAHGAASLAKHSQNPVSSLISVPFENNLTFNNGSEDAVVNVMNVKPVVPVKFSDNWNLVNRAIVPVIYQDERFPNEGSEFGVGDITYQGFFSPAKAGKIIWGLGPTLQFPTGTDDRLTTDKFSVGPTAVILSMPGHWVLGALAQNIWSVAGDDDRENVNAFLLQPFVNYNMKDGWYLSTAPIITANWKADSDDTWTVPVGGGLGRVFKIGDQHLSMKLAVYNSVEKPRFASDWNVQFSVTLMFPK